ncbi:MAG: helix-turn-helix domain-containing protein [Thermoplasmata archaeon]
MIGKNRVWELIIRTINEDCSVIEMIKKLGLKVNIRNINVCIQYSNHLIEFEKPYKNSLKNVDKKGIEILRLDNRKIIIKSKSCTVCKILEKYNSIVINTLLENDEVEYKILIHSIKDYNNIIQELENSGISMKIIKKELYNTIPSITQRQMDILYISYMKGFFDVKRNITLTNLSKELNIKPSTLEYIIRRGLKKFLNIILRKKFKNFG